jgi:hypothetical protein
MEIFREMGHDLPAGSRMRAFKFRAAQRRNKIWDGHNHRSGSVSYINAYLGDD